MSLIDAAFALIVGPIAAVATFRALDALERAFQSRPSRRKPKGRPCPNDSRPTSR
jgi:hypothetical protein